MMKSSIVFVLAFIAANVVRAAPLWDSGNTSTAHLLRFHHPSGSIHIKSSQVYSEDKEGNVLKMEQSFRSNVTSETSYWQEVDKQSNNQIHDIDVQSLAQSIVKTYARNKDKLNNVNINWSCDICVVMVKLIQEISKVNWTKDEIASLVGKECINLKIEDSRVCHGVVRVFRGEVLSVLSSVILKPHDVCGRMYGPSCGNPYDADKMWTIALPDVQKPPVITPTLPERGSPTLRVLHLTDVHIDSQYLVNSSVDCGEPICCRKEDGTVKTGGAPVWGSYDSCDLPRRTLDNLFQHLANNEQFDYIIFTGDIPAHYVWESSKKDTAQLMVNLTDMFLKYFPGKPVYFSLGNHEGVPVNSFPPPWQVVPLTERSDWLYDTAIATWRHWLPRETFSTIKRGGFYTTLVKPGLRIVSLNMNFANSQNWWLLLNMTDPTGQLSWLVSVLQQAETKGEKVQIIGHIPPALCTKPWSWAFYDIVNRYESTIVGQFYGHTHTDEFEVFYDPDTNLTRPTSVAYVAPSVEAANSGNNGYRVYTIDGERANSTWQVLDHETHVMNLSLANSGSSPKWFKSYTAKAFYNMSSLLPKDWDDLVHRMEKDKDLFDQYYRNVHKLHNQGSCDSGCRGNTLCGLRTARPGDPNLCRDLKVTHTEYARWREEISLC